MKAQIDEVIEAASEAINVITHEFSVLERERDPRLGRILGALRRARLARPSYDNADLVVVFDPKTGAPKVDEERANKVISREIDKALAEAEWRTELDVIDSNWDDTLIARMNGTYKQAETEPEGVGSPTAARFMLEGRLKEYRCLAKRISDALSS